MNVFQFDFGVAKRVNASPHKQMMPDANADPGGTEEGQVNSPHVSLRPQHRRGRHGSVLCGAPRTDPEWFGNPVRASS